MDVRVLRYFLAVAREQTISRAAQVVHVTQPTLSRQLRELEEELGRTLFLRGKRRITLTEEGILFRQRAQEIVDLMDKTSAEFDAMEAHVGGEVWIGGGESDAMRLLMRTAHRLHASYPHISYHVFSGNGAEVGERLDRGLVDFGVFIGAMDLSKYDFIALPVKDTWGVLMRRDSPLAARQSIRPEDLAGLPLIGSRQVMVRNEISGWMGDGYDALNMVGSYNLLYNASLMVEEGMGYALCLDRIIRLPESGPLCFRPLEPRLEVGLSVGWKKYQVFSRAAAKFLECLQADLAALAAPGAPVVSSGTSGGSDSSSSGPQAYRPAGRAGESRGSSCRA